MEHRTILGRLALGPLLLLFLLLLCHHHHPRLPWLLRALWLLQLRAPLYTVLFQKVKK